MLTTTEILHALDPNDHRHFVATNLQRKVRAQRARGDITGEAQTKLLEALAGCVASSPSIQQIAYDLVPAALADAIKADEPQLDPAAALERGREIRAEWYASVDPHVRHSFEETCRYFESANRTARSR